ncbi:MAG: PA14 domain-containing protein [Anaerolineae bacterium]|nr:PA14 domain-containing protein [Anaerolineae bacterium]
MAARALLRWMSRLSLVLVVVALIVPSSVSVAQTPPFRGEYYNTKDLSGPVVLVRDDPAVNFAWGTGSPGSPVNVDNFSVRWTNWVSFSAGTYRFTLRVDDGARLYIDEVLVLDRWVPQPATTYTVDRTLSAGYHSLRLEYFEAGGDAVAQLSWSTGGTPPAYPDWKGEYFANAGLYGTPVLTRNDTSINFNWGYGSPATEVPADNFSVRWTRQASFASAGTYTFSATSDDGIRVSVDGTWVINRWADQPATTATGSIYLAAGTHAVTVEYYERTGVALANVCWSLGDSTSTTVYVDDLEPAFTRGGNLSGFHKKYYGYRNHLFWVWNNNTAAYYWGRWTPRLPGPGDYEVQVFIPRYCFGTTAARYRVYHNGTRHDKIVSQALYYDQWVSLGTYYFHAGGGEYVLLASNTGEPYATRPVGYDAVRFIKKSGTTWPTPTPGPTPPSTTCSIVPVLGFGDFWTRNAQVRACLGCATQPEKSGWMAEQTFIGGKMFWRQDTDVIYVLFNNGTWQQFPNTWFAGEPETDPNIVPPAGYYQPRRGFGELWRNNSIVRSALSWGTIEERGFSGAVEPFERGLMLWSPQLGTYALCNDGKWVRA